MIKLDRADFFPHSLGFTEVPKVGVRRHEGCHRLAGFNLRLRCLCQFESNHSGAGAFRSTVIGLLSIECFCEKYGPWPIAIGEISGIGAELCSKLTQNSHSGSAKGLYVYWMIVLQAIWTNDTPVNGGLFDATPIGIECLGTWMGCCKS